jgi:glycosyltransferase involved in cell wall biosynthesis
VTIVVNNHAEMFDATGSGAIATHIWECWRAASPESRPSVYTRLGAGGRYDVEPLNRVRAYRTAEHELPMRVKRRLARSLGWSSWSQRHYARALRPRLDDELGAARTMVLLHNDPEIAIRLARHRPKADVRHLFHNLLEMSPKTHTALRASSARLFAVSEFVAGWVENTVGLAQGSVTTVYNGVDPDMFAPAGPRNRPGMFNVGFLGRPGVEKAPDVLLEAVARMDDADGVHVLLAGLNYLTHHVPDDYQRRLDDTGRRIEARGGRFVRVGRLARARVPDFLRELDVLVVPSRWDEPCALVLFEAMATGLPVVAARTGGTPEVLGDAGVLFERDDVEALRRILEALRHDNPRREALGARARARALGFTWDRTWSALTSTGESV